MKLRRTRGTALSAACCWAVLWLVPQTAPAQLPVSMDGARIVEIEIAGTTAGVTPGRELGIPVGASVNRRVLRRSIQRLMRSGRWADVQLDLVPTPGGVRLVAHLVPRLFVARAEVRGNSTLEDGELLRLARIRAGEEWTEESARSAIEEMAAAYASRGFENAAVRIAVRDTDDPSRKLVIVHVVEGPPTRLTGVVFKGQTPPKKSGARAVLGLTPGQRLDRSDLPQRVRQLEEHLRDQGWLEAALETPEILRRGSEVFLAIPCFMGPRYTVVIHGEAPLEARDVESVLGLSAEKLTASTLSTIQERVQQLYQRHGFYDAAVQAVQRGDPRGGHAQLAINIRPGRQLTITAIVFPGARYFSQSFLRDQLAAHLIKDLPGASICVDSPWSGCRAYAPMDTEVADALGFGGSRRWRREVRRPLVVDPRRVFYEPSYTKAAEHLQELLRSEGFLNAEVGPAVLQRRQKDRALIELPVREGPRTVVHRLVIGGNQVLPEAEILAAAGFSRGDPYSHLELEKARLRILERYREAGHLYAKVEPSVHYSGDLTRALVKIAIEEGSAVTVGRITVQGANQTSEALILDRLTFSAGDRYTPSAARASQESLLALGIFSAVNIAPEDPEAPSRVKRVVVTVAERKWGLLELAAGFSTGQGLRAGFDFGIRNVGGYAVGVNVGIRGAYQFFFVDEQVRNNYEDLALGERLEGRFTVGVTVPHLPRLRNVQLSVDTGFYQDNERDFGINRLGAGTTLTWRPIRQLTFSVSETLERNNVNLFVDEELTAYLRTNTDPRLERLLRVPAGESIIVATGTGVSVDLRDHPFLPTRGAFFSVTGEYAQTLSTEQQSGVDDPFESRFIKVHGTTTGYYPVADRVVFALQLQVGRVFHLTDSSRTYPNRSFFLGGADTMRGYLQDALVPQDLADEIASPENQSRPPEERLIPTGVFRGGDAFVLLRSELRFPLPAAEWLFGGVFAELGNLWTDPKELNPTVLRPTAGAGLRIETPVGPLAFDFGFLLDRRSVLGENPWAFNFSIGLF